MPGIAKVSTKKLTAKSKKKSGRKGALEKARAALRQQRLQTQEGQQDEVPLTPQPSTSSPSPLPSKSASARKLAFLLQDEPAPADSPASLGAAIVQLFCLQELIRILLCPFCFQPTLSLSKGDRTCGLAILLKLSCTTCCKVLSSQYTSAKIDRVFEVNRRAVATSIATGMGQAGLTSFCEMMDMPLFHHKTFLQHQRTIAERSASYSSGMLHEAVDVVRQAYPEQAGNSVIDIDVSYDGSWHTRGHKSMCGIGCVIENRTGLVVDYEVLSKYCHKCDTVGSKLKDNEEVYEEFRKKHEVECDRNHVGSSGSMEQKAAVNMWRRSEEKNRLRYRSVICDGDSNTIRQLRDVDPYEGVVIDKRECVNHVAKRLGTALRKTVENKRKVKVTLGGNGKGKLTQAKILKLQKYYTKAIRSSDTVDAMKRAIWASFNHCTSTNESPKHEDCPKGVDSWCFYQKAISKGLSTPDHAMLMTTFLSPLVAEHIRDVYVRLSDDDLLRRCLDGKTQNANESIHALIWSRCPKHRFVGRQRLEISVGLGVGEFNQGARASQRFISALGLGVGYSFWKYGVRRDGVRKRKAERACEAVFKRRREIRRMAQTREEERLEQLEGGEQYGAGRF